MSVLVREFSDVELKIHEYTTFHSNEDHLKYLFSRILGIGYTRRNFFSKFAFLFKMRLLFEVTLMKLCFYGRSSMYQE